MTLDTRARQAAQGIHRAVEVMEMSRSTLEPRKIARFDRFRDRKQRNRRIGALVVAAMLAIATIVGATIALRSRDTTVPATPSQNGGIVFGERDLHGTVRVYTMNPDGTDVRVLSVSGSVAAPNGQLQTLASSTPVKSDCMSWAPDGSKIYIDGQSIDGQVAVSGLANYQPRRDRIHRAPSHEVRCGALSPDGSRFSRHPACES